MFCCVGCNSKLRNLLRVSLASDGVESFALKEAHAIHYEGAILPVAFEFGQHDSGVFRAIPGRPELRNWPEVTGGYLRRHGRRYSPLQESDC